ncbi:hypothetical protein ACHAQJ_002246 [Trichoderma viride]
MYPENADFDPEKGVIYLSNLSNASVSVYDMRKQRVVDIFTLPGITGNPNYHTGGVQLDQSRRHLTIIANAAPAFATGGEDISGSNLAISYDVDSKKVDWKVNLTAVVKGKYGGFQDADLDAQGNTFALGSFPSSLVKISPNGKEAVAWYEAKGVSQTDYGFSGITAAENGRLLLVGDNSTGGLLRFDPAEQQGRPTPIPLQNLSGKRIGQHLDAILLPKFLDGKVLLVVDGQKGVNVIRSESQKWDKAEVRGVIPNAYASEAGFTVAVIEAWERLYVITEWLDSTLNRTAFPVYDITNNVWQLLE